MSIKLESTTDTPEVVTAALGDGATPKVDEVEESSVVAQDAIETEDESEASSDDKEVEKLEAKDEAESDDSDEDESEEKPEAKPKKSSGFKRRIDKLNSKLSAKDAEIEHWKNEALKHSKNQEAEKPERAAKTDEAGKPQADKFETHEEFVEALADWKVEQKLKAQAEKQKQESLKTEFEKQRDEYMAKAQAFAKDRPDFSEVVEAADDVTLSITVQNAILKHGPELAYELAKDVERLEEICKMPAIDAAEEIGLIRAEMRRSAKKEKPEVKKTKAPAPLKTVGAKGTGSGKKSIYDPNLSQAEYERLRAE